MSVAEDFGVWVDGWGPVFEAEVDAWWGVAGEAGLGFWIDAWL